MLLVSTVSVFLSPSPSSGIVFDESLERGCSWTNEEGKGGETRLNRRDSATCVKYRGNVMSKTRVI